MNENLLNSRIQLFFYFVIFILLFSNASFSAVKIKGGVISSAEVLKTDKPKKRSDLIYDLNKIDFSHIVNQLKIG